MDIAALSIALNQQQLMQQVSLAISKEALDVQEQVTDQLVEMVDAIHPTLGTTIDLSV